MSAQQHAEAIIEAGQRQACIDARLAQAYAVGMNAAHCAGRVELHLGEAIVAYLESLCTVVDKRYPTLGPPKTTAWGFPVVEVANNPAHIAVHVVHDVF